MSTLMTNQITSRLFYAFALSILSATALLASPLASAQSYPSKPITAIVAYPAGGALDNTARLITKEMAVGLKQSIIIDNVAGAGGAIGTAKALRAEPDGYTLIVADVGSMVLTPLTNPNAKYKAEDFKTVSMLAHADIMLVTRKDLGVNTLAELIALSKKNAAKPLSFCTSGIGTNYHLIGERFNALAGIKSLHVPYAGFPQCVTNIVGQDIDYAFVPVAGPFPAQVDNGTLKLIAIAAAKPHSRFSKAPLIKSQKGFEDFVFTAWSSMQVSNKVSDEVVAVLAQQARIAVDSPNFKVNLTASGSSAFDPMSPAEAHAFFLREAAAYRAMAKAINLQELVKQ